MFHADWDDWKHIPRADLYAAVKLSFGIDPRDEVEILPTKRIPFLDSEIVPEERLKHRYRLAIENVNLGLDIEVMDTQNNKPFYKVLVRKFATWASDMEWEIPPELKAMADVVNTTKREISENNKQHVQLENASWPTFDKASPTYPPELDIALQAWRAVSTSEGKGKPKARIIEWLVANPEIAGSKLSNQVKERIATVANWHKTGGATRTD